MCVCSFKKMSRVDWMQINYMLLEMGSSSTLVRFCFAVVSLQLSGILFCPVLKCWFAITYSSAHTHSPSAFAMLRDECLSFLSCCEKTLLIRTWLCDIVRYKKMSYTIGGDAKSYLIFQNKLFFIICLYMLVKFNFFFSTVLHVA